MLYHCNKSRDTSDTTNGIPPAIAFNANSTFLFWLLWSKPPSSLKPSRYNTISGPARANTDSVS
jgi:hypothetical protein